MRNSEKPCVFPLCIPELDLLGHTPFADHAVHDPSVGFRSLAIVAEDLPDIRYPLKGVYKPWPVGILLICEFVEVYGAAVITLLCVVLSRFKEYTAVFGLVSEKTFHDAVRCLPVKSGQSYVGGIDLAQHIAGAFQTAELPKILLSLVSAVVRDEIVYEVIVGEGCAGIFFDQTAVELYRAVVIGDVPVPHAVSFRLGQHPLAFLLAGSHPDGVFRVLLYLLSRGIHAVPVKVCHQVGRPLLVFFFCHERSEKILVFPEQILGQIVLDVQTVLYAVQSLLGAQVEQFVDADTENS